MLMQDRLFQDSKSHFKIAHHIKHSFSFELLTLVLQTKKNIQRAEFDLLKINASEYTLLAFKLPLTMRKGKLTMFRLR